MLYYRKKVDFSNAEVKNNVIGKKSGTVNQEAV
jgi:hypothetical protein